MQPLRKFNNLEERSIGALNAKGWSGRKIRLPLPFLVAGNTPLVSFMFFARNFVASARWTKPCGQNTSHSNNDCHYEQKNENVPQSESESTVQKVINTICFLVSDSVATGYKSSCISNCIISVDMAPSKSSDFCLQFPRPARSTFTWTWHVSPPNIWSLTAVIAFIPP